MEGKKINKVNYTKSVGLYIDDNLSWKKLTTETSKKISSGIGALKRQGHLSRKTPRITLIRPLLSHISLTVAQYGMD